MSLHRCNFCGCDPGVFFRWTSCRRIDVDKIAETFKITDKKYIKSLRRDGYKICLGCLEKTKE